ncbi:tetratricopeptide repeat protein [Parachitinimonas caeni]|uniref:Tetratricopeptide repeat protein n=1 Tax=Parachitinimonas caeni TaxID=3031301 RepID=A0ABT7DXH1_9NEIS|nr:tetratricopeptide repeat protein [Parachitinimonas caeni]MDK2123342.1 tetratricopeptide repeat protein [Parachitinimonas caeni]
MAVWLCATASALVDFDKQWDYDNPAKTETRFAKLLDSKEFKSNPSARAEVRTQIARAQGMQEKFDQAHLTLDSVQDELSHLSPTVSARYMLERGRLISAAGEPKKAQRWFRSAYLFAEKHRLDFYTIDAAHMVALSETGKTALEWNQKALQLAETTTDKRANEWVGSIYNNMGWTYHDLNDYAKALVYLQKALEWHEANSTGKPLLLARWSVGKLLRISGQLEKALDMQVRLEAAFAARKEEDGYVYEEIAETLRLLGRANEARNYYGKAYFVLNHDAWLVRNEPARLARLRQMAQPQ